MTKEYTLRVSVDKEYFCTDATDKNQKLYIYKKNISIMSANNVISTKIEQGICPESRLSELENSLFESLSRCYDNSYDYYALVHKDYLTAMMEGKAYYDRNQYVVTNPYETIMQNDKSNFIIIRINYDDANVVQEVSSGKYLPRKLTFEPTDGTFDLEAILTIVKNRNDLEIRIVNSYGTKRPIPSHLKTATSGNYFIEVDWYPTEQDWEKVVSVSSPRATNLTEIMKKVLCFPENNTILLDEDDMKKVINNMADFINTLDVDEEICKNTTCPIEEYDSNKEKCKKCIVSHFLKKN